MTSPNAAAVSVPLLPWETSPENDTSISAAAALLDEELPEGENSTEDEPVPANRAGNQQADEDDESEAAEESEEESDEEQQEEEPTFEIEGEKVTLTELKNGRLRQADYTRKTQKLAEERKAFEAEQATTRTARDQYAQQLALVERALVELAPAAPDWAKLREENPTEFAAQWAEHQQRQQQLDAVRREQQKLYADQQADYEAAMQRRLEQESKILLDVFPEWRDEAKAAAAGQAIADYARGMGYSEKELSQIHDHRAIVLIDKARRWDELQKKGVQKVQQQAQNAPTKTPPTLKPGAVPQGKAKVTKREAAAKTALNRLSKSGSVYDAAAALENLLDDE